MQRTRNTDVRWKNGSVKRKDGRWKKRNDGSSSEKLSDRERGKHEPNAWKR
jgi:hypothetical protein